MKPQTDPATVLDHSAAQARQVFDALRTDVSRRKKLRTLVYRCPTRHRCTLAEVYRLPDGALIHYPAYKVSPTLNASSTSPEGRAANTTDGNRRWDERTQFLRNVFGLALNCDHVRSVSIDRSKVEQDLKSGRAEIIVTPEETTPAPVAYKRR